MDPELRSTQSGQPVLNIRMATTESYYDSSTKERKERTDWHAVTVWGARGKALSTILSKGSRICVEGRLQTRSFEKDGQKHWATDVVANNIVLLGGGQRNDESGRAGGGNTGGGDFSGDDYANNGSPPNDDIPFVRNETTQGLCGERMKRDKRII